MIFQILLFHSKGWEHTAERCTKSSSFFLEVLEFAGSGCLKQLVQISYEIVRVVQYHVFLVVEWLLLLVIEMLLI